jgi:hypothetical protein
MLLYNNKLVLRLQHTYQRDFLVRVQFFYPIVPALPLHIHVDKFDLLLLQVVWKNKKRKYKNVFKNLFFMT